MYPHMYNICKEYIHMYNHYEKFKKKNLVKKFDIKLSLQK